jgi:predicted acyl esterase
MRTWVRNGAVAVVLTLTAGWAAAVPAEAANDPLTPAGRFFSYDRKATYQVHTEKVHVPVRDGGYIACDLRQPANSAGTPAPGRFAGIVYEYDAYNDLVNLGNAADYFVTRGYNSLVCNARGSGDSPGYLDPFSPQEQQDNYDVIEWFAAQPWSTGRIGQLGQSYGGHSSLLVAVNKPPHLVTIIPINGISDWYENTIYRGGIYSARIRSWQQWLAPDTLTTYAAHPLYDDYWRARSVKARWDDLDIPVLEINGWYDRYRGGMVQNYLARKDNVWLVSGPWDHGWPQTMYAGVGSSAYLSWFDYWLRRLPGATLPPTKVTSYEIPGPGAGGGWQALRDWPPANARSTRLAFTSDGTLAHVAGASGALTYHVNTDTTAAESGEKVAFDTGPLATDLVLAGAITAKVQIALTATDGNVAVVVEDVAADGTASRVSAGWLKVSHRLGHESLAPVRPGVVYDLSVEAYPTHYRVGAGHSLRVVVSSDDYPEIDSDAPAGTVTVRTGRNGSFLQVTTVPS